MAKKKGENLILTIVVVVVQVPVRAAKAVIAVKNVVEVNVAMKDVKPKLRLVFKSSNYNRKPPLQISVLPN
jgi:hypothetical protein